MHRRWPYNKQLTPRAQALRGRMTDAEKKLWYQFLRHQSVRWLRQRPIGQFIVDFYCASSKLVIEVDGSQHPTPEGLAKDAQRTAALEQFGIRVIRFKNHEVLTNFAAVCQQIQTITET